MEQYYDTAYWYKMKIIISEFMCKSPGWSWLPGWQTVLIWCISAPHHWSSAALIVFSARTPIFCWSCPYLHSFPSLISIAHSPPYWLTSPALSKIVQFSLSRPSADPVIRSTHFASCSFCLLLCKYYRIITMFDLYTDNHIFNIKEEGIY